MKASFYKILTGFLCLSILALPASARRYVPPPASAAPPSTAFILTASGSTRGGDYEIGLVFTVGASNITITSLGRLCFSGNTGVHAVSIYSAPTSGSPVLVATANVSTAGITSGTWNYAAASATLTAGVQYALVSSESTASGDQFLEAGGSVLTSTGVATINGAAYRNAGSTGAFTVPGTGTNTGYVVPNFKY